MEEGAEEPQARWESASGAAIWLPLGLATLAGLLLRVWHLDRQILIDDEFHAFRAGLRADLGVGYLFTHNTLPEDPLSDFSSPLALWVRALALTIGIDEWSLRAPMVLASTTIVPVIGVAAWRALGPRTGALAAWLAALSPLLVLFGRFARPYALVALCGAVALAAATRFRQRPGHHAALALGAAVGLGTWFNLSAIPALAVLAWLGFAPALRGRVGPEARNAAALGCVAALAAFALLIGPSLDALAGFAGAKTESLAPTWVAWWGAAQGVVGTRSGAVVALFALAFAAGGFVGMRRAPSLVGLALAAVVAQVGAFALLRPYGGDQSLVIARYGIAALPGVLLLVAIGVDALVERLPGAWLRALVPAVLLGVWVAEGPLPRSLAREDAFTSRPSLLVPRVGEFAEDRVPDYYATLAERVSQASRRGRNIADRAQVVIAEVPWVLEWTLAIPADYQTIHGARVRALTGFWPFRAPGVRLGAHVPWREGEPDLAGIDAVVIHRDLVEEWKAVTGAPLSMDPDRLDEAAARYRTDAAAIEAWLARRSDWELVSEGPWLRVYGPR